MAMWPSPETYALARKARETSKVHEDVCYGFFHGGDPRNFSPDGECSTEEEQAQHKADCEAWDRGERPDIGPPCEHLSAGDASIIVTKSGYGLGVNNVAYPCEGRGCGACEYLGPPDWPLPSDVRSALDQIRRARGQRKAERRRMRGSR